LQSFLIIDALRSCNAALTDRSVCSVLRPVDEREYRKCSSRNRLAAGFWPDRGWGSSRSQRSPIFD